MKNREKEYRPALKRRVLLTLCCVCVISLAGCGGKGGGPQKTLDGTTELRLTPVQVAAGLKEGVAAMPFFLGTDLAAINQGLVEAQASITLDDTYKAVYGKNLSEVSENGDTGVLFRRMPQASKLFQKVMRHYGINDAGRFILTSIDTANSDGYTLYAVVYRPLDYIKVLDKYNGKVVRFLKSSERLFYNPFEMDSDNLPLDDIIDWVALPRTLLKTQKAQAIFITLAANAMAQRSKRPEYWEIEKRWLGGDFLEITEKRLTEARNNLGIL